MSIQTFADIMSACADHAANSGKFQNVLGVEPESSPDNGLTFAMWVDEFGAVPARSGLNSTAQRLIITVRLFASSVQEPAEAIDPELLDATETLMEAYNNNFTLGGVVSAVDVLGMAGVALNAKAGFVKYEDKGARLRVYDITLPLLLEQEWSQVA